MVVTFDGVWDAADETLSTDEQLDEYLIDSPGIHEYTGDEPADDPLGREAPTVMGPSGEPGPDRDDVDPTRSAPVSRPRRWPRRAGDARGDDGGA